MFRKAEDLKIALVFAVLGVVAGAAVVPSLMESLLKLLPEEEMRQVSMPLLMTVSSVQIGVMTLLTSWIGIKLARRTGLKLSIIEAFILRKGTVQWNGKWVLLSLLLGAAAGLLIVGMDKFVFANLYEAIRTNVPESSITGLAAGVLYGGIIEEVLLRLFLMSLLVWLLGKVFARLNKPIPSWIYVLSIIAAAVLFAVGHFPATVALFGELSSTLVVRSFLLNGLAGIAFGYLYWKKGIEYSILSHTGLHVSMQLLFIPLFH
jgi:hypothetical protein